MNSGGENVTEAAIEGLVKSNMISMTITLIDIEQSNSRFEMHFHGMKHLYLYTIVLSNFESLVKGADFYLHESNTRIPHSVLKGATPEEVIIGKRTEDRITELKEKIGAARKLRLETNRALRCTPCLA